MKKAFQAEEPACAWRPSRVMQPRRLGVAGVGQVLRKGTARRSLQTVPAAMKLKDAYSLEGKL